MSRVGTGRAKTQRNDPIELKLSESSEVTPQTPEEIFKKLSVVPVVVACPRGKLAIFGNTHAKHKL